MATRLQSSLPLAVAGAAVAWPSPILPRLLEDTPASLDVSEISWMVSLLYLGEAVGALPSVYLSDKIGRKKTLLYSGVLPIISWSIMLLSGTPVSLYVSRFLAGLQIGVVTIVYPLYISEVSQADVCTSLTALGHITYNAGIFFVATVGPFVSTHVLVSLFLILSGLFPLIFQFAPESPHFLLRSDYIMKARSSLLWLRGDLNRIELEFELDRIEKVVDTQLQSQGSLSEILYSKNLRKDIVVVVLLSVLDGFSGVNVIQAYASTTFPKTTFGILTPNDCVIILSSATFVSSFFAPNLSYMFYGKKLGFTSYCGCSLSTSAVAVWFYLKSKTDVNISSIDFIPLMGCLVHLIICTFFNSASHGFISNQEFSSKMKTNFTLVSSITKSIIYFVLNKIYLKLAHLEGVYVNFFIYSVSCLISATFFVIFWVPQATNVTLHDKQENPAEDEISKSSMTAINGTF